VKVQVDIPDLWMYIYLTHVTFNTHTMYTHELDKTVLC